jgi:protocatechuate 3,4-dioxygenase beta subunit
MTKERTQDVHEDEVHDHDRGLSFDVSTLMTRRRALQLLAIGGLATVVGCGGASNGGSAGTAADTSGAGSTASTAGSAAGEIAEIPEETGGPYPADGSNGVNVLTESGIVRSDITKSFGSASGVAEGVPLAVELTVINLKDSAKAYAGAAVYLWHCNREGEYSLYSQNIASENYLRGVQAAGSEGKVTFTSIFPAAYSGRWPHIHFEVYESVASATSASGRLRTSQLALPEDVCDAVYASDGYDDSVRNLSQTSLESDNVFSDGYSLQLATVTGSVSSGYTARLTVPV